MVDRGLPTLPPRPHLGVTLSLMALLGGCAVGPNYHAPDSKLAPFHNAAAADRPGATPPPLDSWWTGFNDPMLVTVVERALAQNLDLAGAIARIQQARAAASGAHARLLPTLDATGSATREKQSLKSPTGGLVSSLPGVGRDLDEYTAGGSASWEIDLFGGLRRDATAAGDEAQAAEAEGTGVRISVAADAADAYLQVRGYQARLAVAQQQVETDARLLELVKVQRDAGAADDRAIASAEFVLRQARALIQPLRIGLEIQLNRLDVLMGVQPGSYAAELSAVRPVPEPPAVLSGQPADILRRRPDVIAAERRLAASNERIGAALAEFYPKISLAGAIGFDSLSASSLFTSGAQQFVGGGLVRWRLFDFGKLAAQVKIARGANAEALVAYRQSVLKAAEDVEDALVSFTQLQSHEAEQQAEVAALTKARDLSQIAYDAGSVPLTDVLEANRLLLTAQDEYAQTRADDGRAAVRTFRALGGGWPSPGAPMNRPPTVARSRSPSAFLAIRAITEGTLK